MTFINLLQLLLIGLKITGYISWSWWLVMLPFIVWLVLTVLWAAWLMNKNK